MLVEAVQQVQAGLQVELQHQARLREQVAQPVGSDRQAFGFVSGRAGEHAETLPEQMQRQAGTRFMARSDCPEDAAFVEFVIFDQAQLAEAEFRGAGLPGRAGSRMPASAAST